VATERAHDRQQVAHVAAYVRKQERDDFGRQPETLFIGIGRECGGLVDIGERLQLEHQAPADPRAEVVPQRRLLRRNSAREEQMRAPLPARVVQREQPALRVGAEAIDTLDRKERLAADLRNLLRFEIEMTRRHRCRVDDGAREMRLAAARRAPQRHRCLAQSAGGECAQVRHRLDIGAGKEIREARRRVGRELEDQLLGCHVTNRDRAHSPYTPRADSAARPGSRRSPVAPAGRP
jgi:hypothetical protein